MATVTVQGRQLDVEALAEIQSIVDDNPTWSRYRIAAALVGRWDWRNGAGRLKDMSCRRMLARLGKKGLVRLPERRREPVRRASRAMPVLDEIDEMGISGPLSTVQPVRLEAVQYRTGLACLFDGLLSRYHYLGYAYPVGASIRYLARSRDSRPLACAVWSSAALKVACRDRWLGWSTGQRMAGLCRLANNTRFCILPWVRVPHLASHLLGLMVRRLAVDWTVATGHTLALVETFVDESRFHGTCYRAANWLDLGSTTGRTRDDRCRTIHGLTKRVLVLPVLPIAGIRRELTG